MSGEVVDLRSAAAIERAAQPPGHDVELLAARIMVRRTGATVVIQDDGSRDATPDLRIDYPDGRQAVGEVTSIGSQSYLQLMGELSSRSKGPVRYPPEQPLPGDRRWTLTLEEDAHLDTLLREATGLLSQLTEDGRLLDGDLGDFSKLVDHGHVAAGRLRELGVLEAYSQPATPDFPAALVLRAHGLDVARGPHWDALLDHLAAWFDSKQGRNKRAKLQAAGCDETHLLVEVAFSPPAEPWFALSRDRSDLPTHAPRLPEEVTHLWIWSQPGRCLSWSERSGWEDVERHWVQPG